MKPATGALPSCAGLPEHNANVGLSVRGGSGFTVTATVPVVEQLPTPVVVRVYVWVTGAPVVLVSVTVGLATVVLLRPVAGLQL